MKKIEEHLLELEKFKAWKKQQAITSVFEQFVNRFGGSYNPRAFSQSQVGQRVIGRSSDMRDRVQSMLRNAEVHRKVQADEIERRQMTRSFLNSYDLRNPSGRMSPELLQARGHKKQMDRMNKGLPLQNNKVSTIQTNYLPRRPIGRQISNLGFVREGWLRGTAAALMTPTTAITYSIPTVYRAVKGIVDVPRRVKWGMDARATDINRITNDTSLTPKQKKVQIQKARSAPYVAQALKGTPKDSRSETSFYGIRNSALQGLEDTKNVINVIAGPKSPNSRGIGRAIGGAMYDKAKDFIKNYDTNRPVNAPQRSFAHFLSKRLSNTGRIIP